MGIFYFNTDYDYPSIVHTINLINSLIKSFNEKSEKEISELIKKRTSLIYALFFLTQDEEVFKLNNTDFDLSHVSKPHKAVRRDKQIIEGDIKKTLEFLKYAKSIKERKKKAKKTQQAKYGYAIFEILKSLGIEAKNRFILCPFHFEKKPSCRLYIENDTFFCFGCRETGSFEKLIKQIKGGNR